MKFKRLVFFALSVIGLLVLTPLPAPGQTQTTPAVAAGDQLKPGELDALVAPIALYPDNLLALVLMASTYPLEVAQADRWVQENKNLKGAELKSAVDKKGWDDSVKSLVAAPDVLSMMSTKLDWTQKLGDAVLAQQPDVMDAVQRLRTKAQARGKLNSTKEQKVTYKPADGGGGQVNSGGGTASGGSGQVISIEATNPDTLYVPYYDPGVVYGDWPYPEYPAYSFGYPGYIPGGLIATGIAFGTGWAIGRWASGNNYWGGGINWNNNNININRPRVNPLNGANWQHRPEHRQGVRYNNPSVQQKFGGNNLRNSAQNRMDFRGRSGNQVLRPDQGGAGAGRRASDARPGAAQRPAGSRQTAAQRPSGGRQNAARSPSSGRQTTGKRPQGGRQAAQRPSGGRQAAAGRPSGGRGGNAFANVSSGGAAARASSRGHASMASLGGGGMRASVGGGGFRGGGGGGGFRGGGGGGRGGGGRRSDIALKHDIVLLGYLSNGLGFYRFAYDGSDRAYVGLIAQEVEKVAPSAVRRGRDGYLRVLYERVGVKFQTYEHWLASGARLPSPASASLRQ